jgi:hypothetical protein
MFSRRVLVLTAGVAANVAAILGITTIRAQHAAALRQAESDARIDALRAELTRALGGRTTPVAEGTTGWTDERVPEALSTEHRALLVEEVKQQLREEMGLTPLQLLRERRRSFVELYAYDNQGRSNYGTAGYLGDGYFITVKHAVVPLPSDEDVRRDRRIESIRIKYDTRLLRAKVVDSGDAKVEVDRGDWAIVRVRETIDLPPLPIDLTYPYDFAAPIYRLGNDYSKGILLAGGYVGQRTATGLVTALTDGHPGVSGGGVLDQRGTLVGIPIGRMQGDFRFSFILPLRSEMFRRVPALQPTVSVEAQP